MLLQRLVVVSFKTRLELYACCDCISDETHVDITKYTYFEVRVRQAPLI